jgi:hypothetical protein
MARFGLMTFLIVLSTTVAFTADKPAPLINIGFEAGEPVLYRLAFGAVISSNQAEAITGKSAAFYNGATNKNEWNEFLHVLADKINLKGKSNYTVVFKYRVLEKSAEKGFLYFLARAATGKINVNDKGWTEIGDPTGVSGMKVIPIALDDFPDYRLTFGYRTAGKVIIDDIRIFPGTVTAAELK